MSLKSPFAHLFRSAAAKKAADEDDAAKRKAKRADQEDADEGEDTDREDEVVDKVVDDAEDDLKDADDDGEDDADAKKLKAKKAKAKAKDGDDDTDDDDDKDPKARAARARERGRIAAIMSNPAAAANPEQAMFMALRTNGSRDTVIADLKAMAPARPRSDARARLMHVDVPDVGLAGGGSPQPGGSALAAQIIAAGKRARGEI